MKRATMTVLATTLTATMIGPVLAVAATPPTAPTNVVINDGGDDVLTTSEAAAVTVEGDWDPLDLDISDILVSISTSPECDGSGDASAVLHATRFPGGTWNAGPFDLSSFADGQRVCAQATSEDATASSSTVAVSSNAPLLNHIFDAGTVAFNHADAYMNAVETSTVDAIELVWENTDPTAFDAALQFLDATDTLVDPTCDHGVGLAPTGSAFLDTVCAQALPEGDFKAVVTWTDDVGNVASASATMTKDSSVPAPPTIVTPEDYDERRPAPFEMTGTSEPDAEITVYVIRFEGDSHDIEVGSGVADSAGDWSVMVSGMKQGNRRFVAVATDAANNRSAYSQERWIVIDATIPHILTPVADSLNPRYFEVTGIGRPSDTIRVFSGSAFAAGETQVRPDGSWSVSMTAPSGTVSIVARGYSRGVASDVSDALSFFVDADLPQVTVISPEAGATALPGDEVILAGTAKEGVVVGAGVVRVRIIYTDGVRGNELGSEIADCVSNVGPQVPCGQGVLSADWTANALPAGPGIVVASVFAEDFAGNTSQVQSVRWVRL